MATPGEIGDEERRDMMVSYRSGDVIAPALAEREALGQMVNEFATAIRTGRPWLTDGRSGLRVMRILEAASASLAGSGALIALEDRA